MSQQLLQSLLPGHLPALPPPDVPLTEVASESREGTAVLGSCLGFRPSWEAPAAPLRRHVNGGS